MISCEFCSNPFPAWRYQLAGDGDRDMLACERCHHAIATDDRERLLGRVMGAPVPRTLPDRYAPVWRERARKLAEEFWDAREGQPTPYREGDPRRAA